MRPSFRQVPIWYKSLFELLWCRAGEVSAQSCIASFELYTAPESVTQPQYPSGSSHKLFKMGAHVLQGCNDSPGPEADTASNNASDSRLFRFWVTDRRGDKLDYARCTALIYTMGLLLGRNIAPLRPPGSSFTISDTGSDSVL